MNRWEKQVAKSMMRSEAEVLRALQNAYKVALGDIEDKIAAMLGNDMTKSTVYRLQHQLALEKQVKGILDKLHGDTYQTVSDYLEDAYKTGYVGGMYTMSKDGVPIVQPINQDAAVRAIITDSKLSEPLYNAMGVDIAKLKRSIVQ